MPRETFFTGRVRSLTGRFLIMLFFAFVMFFYLWTASTTYFKPFCFPFDKTLGQKENKRLGMIHLEYCNSLADAFLAGHTYITIKPNPKLVALRDRVATTALAWENHRIEDENYIEQLRQATHSREHSVGTFFNIVSILTRM